MRLKTYIKRRELGGAMVWSPDGDDANGTLVDTIHRGLR
jgi:GH18 family chitinase